MPRTDVNLFDTRLWADGVPHEAFRELRARPGLVLHPETETSVAAWNLVRHADVIAASRRPETYSSRPSPFTMKPREGMAGRRRPPDAHQPRPAASTRRCGCS